MLKLLEWSGSPWRGPSGLPVHWCSSCQEPLVLNPELDLTDELSNAAGQWRRWQGSGA